ncbi:ras GEF [Gonapodya prolifera JEL478]|uniref:Ras GEF n=1 Tax=Gonapodya prolifera (strain JEL478) TaxID=1344416 RepID=A0A139AX02_GONPJ|nr:ras GEF [Gonapodya prolifera JEL478]|eukprot:KXS21113.1 ras GEF [Gonapodya prolifera JEL478]
MFQMLENQFWEKQEQDKENVSDGDVALNLTKEEEEILKDSQEGLVVEMNAGTGKEITKGGKLAKLVECLTGHKLPDLEFNSTFLMTHHSFTTSRELLELIIRRYDITPPYGLSQKSFDVFLNKKILPIRIRCCIALKDWISEYFDEDWADDELLVLRFREFVEKRVASDFQKWSQPLLNLLNEKLQGNASPKKPQAVPAVLSPELPLTPKHITNPTQLTSFLKSNPSSFLEIEPLEMARQVTLVEFEYYRAVRPNECLDQIWGERRMTEKLEAGLIKVFRKGDVSSPHISKMINHTNNLTTWVASCVVNNENIKDRVNMMRYFAQFAVACIDCNNFNGATAVVAGLTMSPVTRLHKTWELFREKHAKLAEQYDQIREVVSPKGQYSNYRKALKALQPPVLPFLGGSYHLLHCNLQN